MHSTSNRILKCILRIDWQIEICKLESVWRWFWNPEVWIFEFHQPVSKKWYRLTSTASDRKGTAISENLVFFLSIPRKKTTIGRLVARGYPTIRSSIYVWWAEDVKFIEATEVVEAVEAIEAAVVLRPEKSLLRTSEPYRFLNSALFWCFERNTFW